MKTTQFKVEINGHEVLITFRQAHAVTQSQIDSVIAHVKEIENA